MENNEYSHEFDGDLVNSIFKIFNSFKEKVVLDYDDGFPEYGERVPVDKKEDFIKEIENKLNSKLVKEENIQDFKPYKWNGITGYTISNYFDLQKDNEKVTYFTIRLIINGYKAGALDQNGIIDLQFKLFGECFSTTE